MGTSVIFFFVFSFRFLDLPPFESREALYRGFSLTVTPLTSLLTLLLPLLLLYFRLPLVPPCPSFNGRLTHNAFHGPLASLHLTWLTYPPSFLCNPPAVDLQLSRNSSSTEALNMFYLAPFDSASRRSVRASFTTVGKEMEKPLVRRRR